MDNIILIGYMGSGKSTVGRALAHYKNWPLIDTDIYIEEKQGKEISRIFAEEGESYFRNLETETLEELLKRDGNYIISVGGGLPMRKENRELLSKLGTVIFLRASVDTVLKRLEKDQNRPLLQVEDRKQKITEMLALRNPVYAEAADYLIETDLLGYEEIAVKIQNMLGEK